MGEQNHSSAGRESDLFWQGSV